MSNSVDVSSGFKPAGQYPLVGNSVVKLLSDLSNLGNNNIKAYSYYEDMTIRCIENHITYRWREVEENETGGLIENNFTYPNKVVSNGITYSNRTFNFFPAETKLESFQLLGTNLGRFNDGDTIPEHSSNDERWKDIGRKRILPEFALPIATITASTNPNTSTEVGTTLSNILFTASLTQNDGGAATNFRILKDGTDVLNDVSDNDVEQTFTLSKTPIIFKSIIDYAQGTNTKTDNFGDTVSNPIEAGSDESGNLFYLGYYPVFYGSTAEKYITSSEIRNNLTKRLENSGNTFILNTGTINIRYQLWLPTGKTLDSVIDLDALNAVITSAYVSESITVNDVGGNPINGKLYTMQQDVPYSSNHRHQITITNE